MAASRGAAGTWTPEAAAFAAMERRLDEMAREMVGAGICGAECENQDECMWPGYKCMVAARSKR